MTIENRLEDEPRNEIRAGRRAGRRAWPFRVAMTIAAVVMSLQPVLAGEFMSESYSALDAHRGNANGAIIAVLVALVCAILLRWPGRSPRWPMLACLVLFGLTAVQIAFGNQRVLSVHVPLGVAIVAITVWLAVWSWRAARIRAIRAPSSGCTTTYPARTGERRGGSWSSPTAPPNPAGTAGATASTCPATSTTR